MLFVRAKLHVCVFVSASSVMLFLRCFVLTDFYQTFVNGAKTSKCNKNTILELVSPSTERSYCFQRVLAITVLSVCPSVCRRSHGWISQNDASYDHQIFTIGCLEDSSFRKRKAFL